MLRLKLEDPKMKKKQNYLYEMVDAFFQDEEEVDFTCYQEKYFSDAGSKVFSGFGILDQCYSKLFEPIEKRVVHYYHVLLKFTDS
jgi:hypothetical protein